MTESEQRSPTRSELLGRIRHERAMLEQSIARLSPAQMAQAGAGGWSAKDLLAHIVAWEQVLLVKDIQGGTFAEAAGMDAATSAATEHMTAETGLNDYFYERDRDLPLDAVLARARESYQQVLAALEELSDAELQRPTHGARLIDSVIDNTCDHYREHRLTIEAMLTR